MIKSEGTAFWCSGMCVQYWPPCCAVIATCSCSLPRSRGLVGKHEWHSAHSYIHRHRLTLPCVHTHRAKASQWLPLQLESSPDSQIMVWPWPAWSWVRKSYVSWPRPVSLHFPLFTWGSSRAGEPSQTHASCRP